MPEFTNMNEILDFVGTGIIVPIIREDIGNVFTEIYKDAVEETVYADPNAGGYQRTRAMKNSVSYEISRDENGDIIILVGADPDKMKYSYPSWTTYPPDQRWKIADWLNNGHGGNYYGHPISYGGKKFNELAGARINSLIKKIFLTALRSKGFKVTQRINEKGRDTRTEEKDFDYI